jgi:hypothetical protein
VTDPLVRHELQVLAAEGMTAARREIPEGHLVGTPYAGLDVMNRCGESVRWHPLDQGIGLQKGAVNALWLRAQDSMKANCVGHDLVSLQK